MDQSRSPRPRPHSRPQPHGQRQPRSQYKPPMSCFAKFMLTIIVCAVLVAGAMAGLFHYLKNSNPDLTPKEFLTFAWKSTKKTVAKYKDEAEAKIEEWKKALKKSKKTQAWLDKMFPAEKDDGPVSAGPTRRPRPTSKYVDSSGRNVDPDKRAGPRPTDSYGRETPTGDKPPTEPGDTPKGTEPADTTTPPEPKKRPEPTTPKPVARPKPAPAPESDWNKEIHPEFQATADNMRAGLKYFQQQKFKKALEKFERAEQHLDKYKAANPDDYRVEEMQGEITYWKQAAMKHSGWGD
ncbi:MAG: hypothetical protein E3J72_08815 [Planctomycetota bacterium]|nr:MAG: hypothetical protein E3J72_08815 [Planctomycetota bacterium]